MHTYLNRPNFLVRDTTNPQLFAIIGASLGTFGAYLINDSARSLAIGSLIGAGVGGYMGTKYSIDLPKTDFFDKLFISAAPQFSPEGDLGVQMQLRRDYRKLMLQSSQNQKIYRAQLSCTPHNRSDIGTIKNIRGNIHNAGPHKYPCP